MTIRKLFYAATVAVVLSWAGCAAAVDAPAVPLTTAPEANAAWARVLRGFVNSRGEVDFAALAKDRGDLDRYVRYVADTPLDSPQGRTERLAHLINAYNALSMFNVIESGIPTTHAGLNKVTFFYIRKLPVGGRMMSLYALENDVIRPYAREIGEPRVHFALNCSARSCPVLPMAPFTATALDAELEREARAFFARPESFRIDETARTVWLNEILKFYTEDFIPAHGSNLIAFANRYAPRMAPLDFAVRFTPYDWTVANSKVAR